MLLVTPPPPPKRRKLKLFPITWHLSAVQDVTEALHNNNIMYYVIVKIRAVNKYHVPSRNSAKIWRFPVFNEKQDQLSLFSGKHVFWQVANQCSRRVHFTLYRRSKIFFFFFMYSVKNKNAYNIIRLAIKSTRKTLIKSLWYWYENNEVMIRCLGKQPGFKYFILVDSS